MKKHRFLKINAQSTVEYAVLVACIVAAVIGMQIYIKRGIQGRLRQGGDEIGQQYSAGNTGSTTTTTTTSTWTINQSMINIGNDTDPKYGLKTNTTVNETTTKSGNEKIGAFEYD
jgi:Flp pilus assembly pilin Flp